jgi:hypothetical protein
MFGSTVNSSIRKSGNLQKASLFLSYPGKCKTTSMALPNVNVCSPLGLNVISFHSFEVAIKILPKTFGE